MTIQTEIKALHAKLEEKKKIQAIPKPLENIEWDTLVEFLNGYLEELPKGNDNEDDPHYIYENVLKLVYGNNIFKFINKHRN
jgi:hypothetical protein